MGAARDRVEHQRLSRSDWAMFALLATIVVAGVTLEISRISGRPQQPKGAVETAAKVTVTDTSGTVPGVGNLSTR